MSVICEKCGTELQIGMYPFCKGTSDGHGSMSHTKNALFPFETKHVDGKPMVIESLNHLRKVERDFGVTFSAFSKANHRDLDDIQGVPRYRGDDEDTRRNYRDRYEQK